MAVVTNAKSRLKQIIYPRTLAEAVKYDNDTSGLDAVDVQGAVDELVSKEFAGTLTSSGWSGTAPYTQTVSISGITATTKGTIGLQSSATSQQREAARDAMLFLSGQGANSVTIVADGDKPTVNIPIAILEVI